MPDEQSLIQDLREIEKDFRDKGEYRKANVIDLFIIQSTRCKIKKEKFEKIQNLYEEICNKYAKLEIDLDITKRKIKYLEGEKEEKEKEK